MGSSSITSAFLLSVAACFDAPQIDLRVSHDDPTWQLALAVCDADGSACQPSIGKPPQIDGDHVSIFTDKPAVTVKMVGTADIEITECVVVTVEPTTVYRTIAIHYDSLNWGGCGNNCETVVRPCP